MSYFFRECRCVYYRRKEFWENLSAWGILKSSREKGRRPLIKISLAEVCTRCTRSKGRRDSEKYAVVRNALNHLFDPRGNALSTKHLPFTKRYIYTVYVIFLQRNIINEHAIRIKQHFIELAQTNIPFSRYLTFKTIFAACLIRRYIPRITARFIFCIKFLSRDISISECFVIRVPRVLRHANIEEQLHSQSKRHNLRPDKNCVQLILN